MEGAVLRLKNLNGPAQVVTAGVNTNEIHRAFLLPVLYWEPQIQSVLTTVVFIHLSISSEIAFYVGVWVETKFAASSKSDKIGDELSDLIKL